MNYSWIGKYKIVAMDGTHGIYIYIFACISYGWYVFFLLLTVHVNEKNAVNISLWTRPATPQAAALGGYTGNSPEETHSAVEVGVGGDAQDQHMGVS